MKMSFFLIYRMFNLMSPFFAGLHLNLSFTGVNIFSVNCNTFPCYGFPSRNLRTVLTNKKSLQEMERMLSAIKNI
jgi:hypothetical protein